MTPDAGDDPIRVHLDELLAERGMTLTELSERVGVTVVNLSVLKNDRARAVRFSTLAAICRELGCQPGDVLTYEPRGARAGRAPRRTGGSGSGRGPRAS